jgi:hypothetical protein
MTLDITGVAGSSTVPIQSLQDKTKAPSGSFSLDDRNGWIMWKSYASLAHEEKSRLCWVPVELRGDVSASREGTFVFASRSTHQLTVIDFTQMLKSLYRQGFLL